MVRYTQIKKHATPADLRGHLADLALQLPVADAVDPAGPLARPITITDGATGTHTLSNRFAVLPMEGWDGTTDGHPTELVERRWDRFAMSGCSLVWGEATAVVADGRANPNQLVLTADTVDSIAALRARLAADQYVGLQLTHSGRWARPLGAPLPRTAQHHPVLDGRTGRDPGIPLRADELDDLVDRYVTAAALAARAGFDFVDVKCCHGYLLHELLGARTRADDYGGAAFDARTRFFRTVVERVRAEVPTIAVAVRVSIFDWHPWTAGPDGIGVPDGGVDGSESGLPRPFGGTDDGLGIDLTETHAFLDLARSLGIGLVCTTAGSPYYNPHIQRPAFFPPSDGYQPPEDPLIGVHRQIRATAELAHAHPDLVVVGSGYSYLQDFLAHVGQEVVAARDVDMVGLGRMILSYPHLAADVLAGREFDRRLVCRTFSDCTTAPRGGLVSGCYPLDDFYKNRPERVELAAMKRRIRTEAKEQRS